MNKYDVALSCYTQHDCVERELKILTTKDEATKFIEDFIRRVIRSYCKNDYCLSAVETDGFYTHNYVVRLTKEVTMFIHIDNY